MVPVMCGCKEQKYAYSSGVENVNEYDSSVSITFDLNARIHKCGQVYAW